MIPFYKGYNTNKLSALLTFNLVALLSGVQQDVQASDLDKLRVRLIRENITGALLLTHEDNGGNYMETDEAQLLVHLVIPAGRSRVMIEAEYGTNVCTMAIVDIDTDGTDTDGVFEPAAEELTVVKQLGGGGSEEEIAELDRRVSEAELALAGKADGSIYRVGESGNPAVTDVAKVYAHSVELSPESVATGMYAVAEGSATTASGEGSHAEGLSNSASGEASHAEGNETTASGEASHAEGMFATASGEPSHAEGMFATASGMASHAEGSSTTASGSSSHAEGSGTTASGGSSHAEGRGTIASARSQHVSGEFNIEDTVSLSDQRGEFAFIIGNGTTVQARSNAFAIKWDGTIVVWNNGTRVELTPAKLATLVS